MASQGCRSGRLWLFDHDFTISGSLPIDEQGMESMYPVFQNLVPESLNAWFWTPAASNIGYADPFGCVDFRTSDLRIFEAEHARRAFLKSAVPLSGLLNLVWDVG